MGFRTVVLTNRAKVDYRLGYMVVRGEQEKQIFLAEINTLIFESTAISLTAVLLCELIKRNIKVIFCDEKHSPHSELLPYYSSYNSSKRIKTQIDWMDETKSETWKLIINKKICCQLELLKKQGHLKQADMLNNYLNNIMPNDTTNREGHAAKVYFNVIFGEGFVRGRDDFINRSLNYGYAILLSAFNREIAASGFLTQIGIFHKNEFNDFNLSCDLMEPFRTIVDNMVLIMDESLKFKHYLANLMNIKVSIGDINTTLDNGIKIYVRSVLDCLCNNDKNIIKFLDAYEL